jgi:hypothetical protein
LLNSTTAKAEVPMCLGSERPGSNPQITALVATWM